MDVKIQYTGQLARAAGVPEENIEVDEAVSVRAAIISLAESRGGEFKAILLNAEGNLRSSLLVILGGQQATDGRIDAPCGAERTVLLMTPIAGG